MQIELPYCVIKKESLLNQIPGLVCGLFLFLFSVHAPLDRVCPGHLQTYQTLLLVACSQMSLCGALVEWQPVQGVSHLLPDEILNRPHLPLIMNSWYGKLRNE